MLVFFIQEKYLQEVFGLSAEDIPSKGEFARAVNEGAVRLQVTDHVSEQTRQFAMKELHLDLRR